MIKRIMTDVDVKAGIQQILKRVDAAYEQRPKVSRKSIGIHTFVVVHSFTFL